MNRVRTPLGECPTWPTDFAARYRAAGFWTGQTFPQLLAGITDEYADRTAVIDRHSRYSYRDLGHAAVRVAAGLRSVGVRPGDRVVVQMSNSAGFVAVIFGIWQLGALPVFTLPAHRDTEIEQFCAMTDAAAYIFSERVGTFDHLAMAQRVAARLDRPPVLVRAGVADGSRAGEVAALDDWLAAAEVDKIPEPRADASAVAFLQLSGGTTGLPKLIPRTHDDYLYSVRRSAEICELTADDVMLVALPAAHNFTMSSPGILGILCAGGSLVMAPDPSPTTCFPLIEREGVSITALVPPLALGWLSHHARRPGRLDSLRLIQVGGAKLSPQAARRMEPELGCRLQQVFGMAEGLVNYTRPDDPSEVVTGSQGRPISEADEILIVDDADRPVPAGAEGHLLTRGPYTIRGYYAAAEHNATTFTQEGFYRTGDLVRRLPSGHLVVTGRAKDQINRGGDKIASDEIEDHLLAHPAVLDAAVVGLPDDYLGERSCAFVVTDPAFDGDRPAERELRDHLRDRGLATFKIPDQVQFVPTFPITGVGKTSRRQLRSMLAAGSRAGTAPTPAPQHAHRVHSPGDKEQSAR